MMNFATKSAYTRIVVWLVWFVAFFVFVHTAPHQPTGVSSYGTPSLLGVVVHDQRNGPLFPWQSRLRWKKHALRRYRRWRAASRRAKRAAFVARLALCGMLSAAQVVDWLTQRQLRYKVGALPVLYTLLDKLNVRAIINRHCPSRRQVDNGTVALVVVLNRLLMPLPLYRVSDWVSQTVLVGLLGVEASKFNDDRLGRTLDALYPHLEAIWREVVEQALVKADVDLSVIFYDLTAFIAHGRYANSELIDFGFAHNTPSNKRKFKLSLNTLADGNIPWVYKRLHGRTADQATVQSNMSHLAQWLARAGRQPQDSLLVGDRAMLNDEIALAYEAHGLKHLTGLRCSRLEHRHLLTQWSTKQLERFPIVEGDSPQYWGRGCQVRFEHNGRSCTHKGLVVLAGPLRDQWQASRNKQLDELEQQLAVVQADIGKPRLRSVKAVQRRVNARCRASKVGKLMTVSVSADEDGSVHLSWLRNIQLIREAEQRDGRYLLVTNEWSLSHQRMFQLYRQKDGGEKRFHICKNDLNVSPVYLHKDKRIASMLMLNMLALLAYSLLERQVRQQGLNITTRQLIQRLQNIVLIETRCIDGSVLRRLTPIDDSSHLILKLVSDALHYLNDDEVVANLQPLLPIPQPRQLPMQC